MSATQLQFHCDKTILVLDGCVMEYFLEGTTSSMRFHVDHLKMDVKPKGDDWKVTFGQELFGRIQNGGGLKVPAAKIPEFEQFVAATLANRSSGRTSAS
jgi:hypothetical protein